MDTEQTPGGPSRLGGDGPRSADDTPRPDCARSRQRGQPHRARRPARRAIFTDAHTAPARPRRARHWTRRSRRLRRPSCCGLDLGRTRPTARCWSVGPTMAARRERRELHAAAGRCDEHPHPDRPAADSSEPPADDRRRRRRARPRPPCRDAIRQVPPRRRFRRRRSPRWRRVPVYFLGPVASGSRDLRLFRQFVPTAVPARLARAPCARGPAAGDGAGQRRVTNAAGQRRRLRLAVARHPARSCHGRQVGRRADHV